MFITPAFAQAAPAASGGNALIQLLPFIAIIAIMYFLIIRPQQKRAKEHREMIAAIRRGDIVVTAGGLIGKVVKVVGDSELQVELAEGVRVRALKATIAEVRTKTEPYRESSRRAVEDDDEPEDDQDDDEFMHDDDEPERKPAKPAGSSKMAAAPSPVKSGGSRPAGLKKGRTSPPPRKNNNVKTVRPANDDTPEQPSTRYEKSPASDKPGDTGDGQS